MISDTDDCDDCDDCGLVDDAPFDGSSAMTGVVVPCGVERCAAHFGGLFDDLDESLNRYGSLDPSSTWTHRVVTPPLLAGLTGVALATCQSFHHLLFCTLEDVGDFDGLIVAPPVCIGTRSERFESAARWAIEHPAPDVGEIWADINTTDEADTAGDDLQATVTRRLSNHSLALSLAMNSNPTLTFGSTDALVDRLLDDMFGLADSWSGDEIARLADVALTLIGCIADVTGLVGGAHVGVLEPIDRATIRRFPALGDARETS